MTIEQRIENILEAVKQYLDSTARAHNCAGFDCSVCALNGYRFQEAKDAAFQAWKNEGEL